MLPDALCLLIWWWRSGHKDFDQDHLQSVIPGLIGVYSYAILSLALFIFCGVSPQPLDLRNMQPGIIKASEPDPSTPLKNNVALSDNVCQVHKLVI